MKWQKTNKSGKKAKFFFAFLLAAVFITTSCTENKSNPVIIWTNRQELASYAELFNSSQTKNKVVVIYKEKPAESLPHAKDEQPPDIVIGSWLKNSTVKKNFRPLDYLFSEQQINQSIFYPNLLNSGNLNDRQYLLPVSFNIPAVIFAKENQEFVKENHIIDLEQIRDTAATYNKFNKSNIYTHMGFGTTWETDFMYLTAKMFGSEFNAKGNLFTWNQEKLDEAAQFLKDWTKTANTSTTAESDFAFKYLYTPGYKQVVSGNCLFAYTTSNALFEFQEDKLLEIDFRWIHNDYKIPVEDDMIFLGLYKKGQNSAGAEDFITWFMQIDNQQKLLERNKTMGLSVNSFGIAGGFSAIRNVNEQIFPVYYQSLLGNLPAAEYLVAPATLPAAWESIKDRVVIPWLQSATNTDNEAPTKTMDSLISEWSKQFS
ncbi:MAG: carbohydrate ABC transporter substrate-binding protein [Spirochaetaceae bacterium]|nr:carbohydrate ABC transporter substrate-binding protein [Spirochaetaceae bacterium]